jgi:3-dehydroquinate dehydratase-2
MRVLVIHGPNLNMLGIREPHIYGTTTLDEVNAHLVALGQELGATVECFQSNHEGAIVDRIQQGHGTGLAGAILNPGGLTQYSVSVLDAIKAVDYPFFEVHLSNLHRREAWRGHSLISEGVVGIVQGFGWRGYLLALRGLVELAKERA